MMRTLILAAGLAASLQAANVDTPAVGEDLNGWQKGGVAWYGTDDLSFRAFEPVTRPTADGGLEITMRVEEVRRRVPVYVANIRLLAAGDGTIYSASVHGEVVGVAFKTGEVSRPEPVASGEEAEAIETPLSPDEQMRQDLAALLGSAIDGTRSGKGPRFDLSARLFQARAGESASLTRATMVAVRSLFRRTGR